MRMYDSVSVGACVICTCIHVHVRTPRSYHAYLFGKKREYHILFKKQMIDIFHVAVFLRGRPTIHFSKAIAGRQIIEMFRNNFPILRNYSCALAFPMFCSSPYTLPSFHFASQAVISTNTIKLKTNGAILHVMLQEILNKIHKTEVKYSGHKYNE